MSKADWLTVVLAFAGTAIGGFIAALVGVWFTKKRLAWQRRVDYNMRLRSKILTPLYNGLVAFRKELQEGFYQEPESDRKWYWWEDGLRLQRGEREWRGHPSFVVWDDMKRDFKALYTERIRGSISSRLDDLTALCRAYNSTLADFCSAYLLKMELFVKEKTGGNYASGIGRWLVMEMTRSMSSKIVDVFNTNKMTEAGVSDEEMWKVAGEMILEMAVDQRLSDLKNQASEIVKEVDSLVEDLGNEILNIVDVYELEQRKEKDVYPKVKAIRR